MLSPSLGSDVLLELLYSEVAHWPEPGLDPALSLAKALQSLTQAERGPAHPASSRQALHPGLNCRPCVLASSLPGPAADLLWVSRARHLLAALPPVVQLPQFGSRNTRLPPPSSQTTHPPRAQGSPAPSTSHTQPPRVTCAR